MESLLGFSVQTIELNLIPVLLGSGTLALLAGSVLIRKLFTRIQRACIYAAAGSLAGLWSYISWYSDGAIKGHEFLVVTFSLYGFSFVASYITICLVKHDKQVLQRDDGPDDSEHRVS